MQSIRTITVSQVFSKTFDGRNGKKFTVYSTKVNGTWLTLKGDFEKSKQGDQITGIISIKHYTKKDGSQGTSYEIKPMDPVIKDILERLEKLEARI